MREKVLVLLVVLFNIGLAYFYRGFDVALFAFVYGVITLPLILFKNWYGLSRFNTLEFLGFLPSKFSQKFNEVSGWILLPMPSVILLFLLIKKYL